MSGMQLWLISPGGVLVKEAMCQKMEEKPRIVLSVKGPCGPLTSDGAFWWVLQLGAACDPRVPNQQVLPSDWYQNLGSEVAVSPSPGLSRPFPLQGAPWRGRAVGEAVFAWICIGGSAGRAAAPAATPRRSRRSHHFLRAWGPARGSQPRH